MHTKPQTIDETGFIQGFQDARIIAFSTNGLKALYEHITDRERDEGEDYEFDPMDLTLRFTQHNNALEALNEVPSTMTEDEARDELEGCTTLITFDGGVIILDY